MRPLRQPDLCERDTTSDPPNCQHGRNRTRFCATHYVVTSENQREVIGGDGWQPTHDISRSEIEDEGWHIFTSGPDAQLQNFSITLDPRSITYLTLQMRVEGETGKRMKAQLFWHSINEGFSEEQSVLFSVVPDGQAHLYLLRLASFPSWAWRGPITGLRLDPTDTSGVKVVVSSIEFIQVDEPGKDAKR